MSVKLSMSMFQMTSQMKSYLVDLDDVCKYHEWMKGNTFSHSHHLCSLFHFLFLFGRNVTVLFDAGRMFNKRSDGRAAGKYRRERSWSWTTVNVVDRRAVDTDDTVDTDAVTKMTQSVSERCRQDMGETRQSRVC